MFLGKIFPDMYTRKGLLWHQALKLENLYTRADKIIAVSQHTKNDLIRFYDLLSDKIRVVYSGLPDREEFSETKQIILPSNKFFLFLVILNLVKILLVLVDAFLQIKDKLPEVDLIIAGGCKLAPRYALKLFKKITKQPRIHYLGYVDNKQNKNYIVRL